MFLEGDADEDVAGRGDRERRVPAVIVGVDQKMTRKPTINGCRTRLYRPRSVKAGGLYLTCRACRQACRSPNRSAWLMRNVDQMASPQPPAYAAHITPAAGPESFQTVPSIGRHSRNTSTRARFAARTNVARSAGSGTNRVHWRLNHGRAITEC